MAIFTCVGKNMIYFMYKLNVCYYIQANMDLIDFMNDFLRAIGVDFCSATVLMEFGVTLCSGTGGFFIVTSSIESLGEGGALDGFKLDCKMAS